MSNLHVYLENTLRFWEAQQAGTAVVTRWGRIGTRGQSGSLSFRFDTDAVAFIHEKVREKTRKGYSRITLNDADERLINCRAGHHEWVAQASRRPITQRCMRCGVERVVPASLRSRTRLTDLPAPPPQKPASSKPVAPARRRRFSDDD